jgi:hypothetical protein
LVNGNDVDGALVMVMVVAVAVAVATVIEEIVRNSF